MISGDHSGGNDRLSTGTSGSRPHSANDPSNNTHSTVTTLFTSVPAHYNASGGALRPPPIVVGSNHFNSAPPQPPPSQHGGQQQQPGECSHEISMLLYEY
jgi:hypothetical protein